MDILMFLLRLSGLNEVPLGARATRACDGWINWFTHPGIREQTGINSATKWRQANQQVETLTATSSSVLPKVSVSFCLEILPSLFSFDGSSKDVLGNEPLSGMLQRLDRWFFFIEPSKPLQACPTEHVMETTPWHTCLQAICENRSMGLCVLGSEKYFKVHWPGFKVQDDKYYRKFEILQIIQMSIFRKGKYLYYYSPWSFHFFYLEDWFFSLWKLSLW